MNVLLVKTRNSIVTGLICRKEDIWFLKKWTWDTLMSNKQVLFHIFASPFCRFLASIWYVCFCFGNASSAASAIMFVSKFLSLYSFQSDRKLFIFCIPITWKTIHSHVMRCLLLGCFCRSLSHECPYSTWLGNLQLQITL